MFTLCPKYEILMVIYIHCVYILDWNWKSIDCCCIWYVPWYGLEDSLESTMGSVWSLKVLKFLHCGTFLTKICTPGFYITHYKDAQDTRQKWDINMFSCPGFNSFSDCFCISHVDWYGWVNIWEQVGPVWLLKQFNTNWIFFHTMWPITGCWKFSFLNMYLLYDELFMPQNGGTLLSAVMTLITLFSYFGLLPCLMGPRTI